MKILHLYVAVFSTSGDYYYYYFFHHFTLFALCHYHLFEKSEGEQLQKDICKILHIFMSKLRCRQKEL